MSKACAEIRELMTLLNGKDQRCFFRAEPKSSQHNSMSRMKSLRRRLSGRQDFGHMACWSTVAQRLREIIHPSSFPSPGNAQEGAQGAAQRVCSISL